jgi:hypothetical protein
MLMSMPRAMTRLFGPSPARMAPVLRTISSPSPSIRAEMP